MHSTFQRIDSHKDIFTSTYSSGDGIATFLTLSEVQYA